MDRSPVWGVRGGRRTASAVVLALLAAPLLLTTQPAESLLQRDFVFVAHAIESTVLRIDAETLDVYHSNVRVGTQPRAIAVTPDGSKAYVAASCSNRVTVTHLVDGSTKTVSVGMDPRALAVAPDGKLVYVANFGSDTITPILTSSDIAGPPIAVGKGPVGIAVAPDGDMVYTADAEGGTVTPVRTADHRAGDRISVGGRPSALAVSPDGRTVYVADAAGGTVIPVDLITGSVGSSIGVGGRPSALAISPDGRTVYVADAAGGTITLVDVTTRSTGSPISVGAEPRGIALAAGGSRAYVANYGSNTVSVLDTSNGRVVATVGVGAGPSGIAVAAVLSLGMNQDSYTGGPPPITAPSSPPDVTPANAAYVANVCDASVSVVDLDEGSTVGTIGVGSQPAGVAITPDGKTAYVTNFGDDTVTPIDTGTNSTGDRIPVGKNPAFVAITPDGSTALVANYGESTITPIDTATNTPGDPILIGEAAKASAPSAIAIHPDGTRAYVTTYERWSVAVIDLEARKVVTEIHVGQYPGGMAITPDGKTAYAAVAARNGLVPIDTATNVAGDPILVGAYPTFVAITPDGSTAYVPNTGESSVSVVDLATGFVRRIDGPFDWPQPVAVSPDGFAAYVGNYGPEGRAPRNTLVPLDTSTDSTGPPIAVGFGPEAIAIVPDQAPTASFEVTAGTPGSLIRFDASASSTSRGTIVRYEWDFGDGTEAVTDSPTIEHTYPADDVYTATLTVTNSLGTSTEVVFTGQTVSRNGGPRAQTAGKVAVGNFHAPGSPRNVTAAANGGRITLEWSPPADDGGTEVTRYRVYRGTTSGATSFLGEIRNALTYTDTGLAGNTTYQYAVSAVNAVGEGARSAEVSATTPPGPPEPPLDLTGSRSNGVVHLSWAKPEDNGSAITSYKVYWGSPDGVTLLTTLPGTVTTFGDDGPPIGDAYYEVTAVNAIGEGAPATLTVEGVPAPTITSPQDGSVVRNAMHEGAWGIRIAGTALPGATVEVFEREVSIGSATVDEKGSWRLVRELAEGEHTITAAQTDAVGNTSPPTSGLSFGIDETPPTIDIRTEEQTVFLRSTVRIEGTATDAADGLGVEAIGLEYWTAAGLWGKRHATSCTGCRTGAAEVTWFDEPALPPGLYHVRAYAFDEAGNASDLDSIHFYAL